RHRRRCLRRLTRRPQDAVRRRSPQVADTGHFPRLVTDTVEAPQTRGATMSKYTVDSEAVQAASASIRGITEQLRADVNTLMGQIQNLQSQWTGQAASAFTAAAHDWRTTQARVEESINELN